MKKKYTENECWFYDLWTQQKINDRINLQEIILALSQNSFYF